MSRVTLNSNIAALTAQRRLGESTSALQASFERLASGLRVNRASDDAAGLAIAAGLNVDARVYAQGLRNVNDAVSLLSIAEAGVRELSSMVVRMRELAAQAASGSYSAVQREALDREAWALAGEYNRIIATTEFNGLKLLDGSKGSIRLAAGAEGGAALSLGLPEIASFESGNPASSTRSLAFDGINDYVDIPHSSAIDFGAADSFSFAAWFNTSADFAGLGHIINKRIAGPSGRRYALSFDASENLRAEISDGTTLGVVSTSGMADGAWHLAVGVVDRSTQLLTLYVDGVPTGSVDISAVGSPSSTSNLNIGKQSNSNIRYFNGSIDDVRIYNEALSAADIAALYNGGEPSSTGLVGHWKLDEGSGISTADNSGNGNHGTLINGPTWSTDVPAALAGTSPAFSLLTPEGAFTALVSIAALHEQLTGALGSLGAQQSRLGFEVANLRQAIEQFRAAESRIVDADIAEESANLVRNQILQQAGAAVLGQANQLPALALQLLRQN